MGFPGWSDSTDRFQWLDVVAARLEHKPADLVPRFTWVHQVDPAAGAHELTALTAETYDLIEQNLPQVNVARLRAIFRHRRPHWDHAPPTCRETSG